MVGNGLMKMESNGLGLCIQIPKGDGAIVKQDIGNVRMQMEIF